MVDDLDLSPSTRRAWIEMSGIGGVTMSYLVALHPEGVDRNQQCLYLPLGWDGESPSTRRAWIEISPGRRLAPGDQSPSTRRAWIEIGHGRLKVCGGGSPSTRRAWIEIASGLLLYLKLLSPSTRRAWIEIATESSSLMMHAMVALHPEGVDRNLSEDGVYNLVASRPPPGGRG